ncbi:MAG: helix-turn-helix transcriptional regulator [Chloroflexi bacterium]|nr:helix-turn-helix transcriptional regulator [Chloroflexota bacterium]
MSDSWERIRPDPIDPIVDLGMQQLGAWLKMSRRVSGMTQQHLENLTGIDQTTLSRLENGRLRSLRLMRLARLVGALHDPRLAAVDPWGR